MYLSFTASILALFTKWGGVACKITSVRGLQLPVGPRKNCVYVYLGMRAMNELKTAKNQILNGTGTQFPGSYAMQSKSRNRSVN